MSEQKRQDFLEELDHIRRLRDDERQKFGAELRNWQSGDARPRIVRDLRVETEQKVDELKGREQATADTQTRQKIRQEMATLSNQVRQHTELLGKLGT